MHSPHQKTLKNSPSSAAQQRSRKDSSAVTHHFQDNRANSVAQRHLQESMQSHTPNTIQLREENNTQRQTNRTGLPDQLKSGVENLSGVAMDDVRVHYNSSKPAQLQAHAYAQGTDIHLAPGQEKHLPHEAWHVVQQKQGRVKPTKQLKAGVQLNDEARLEREADVMGRSAIQMAVNTKLNLITAAPSLASATVAQRIPIADFRSAIGFTANRGERITRFLRIGDNSKAFREYTKSELQQILETETQNELTRLDILNGDDESWNNFKKTKAETFIELGQELTDLVCNTFIRRHLNNGIVPDNIADPILTAINQGANHFAAAFITIVGENPGETAVVQDFIRRRIYQLTNVKIESQEKSHSTPSGDPNLQQLPLLRGHTNIEIELPGSGDLHWRTPKTRRLEDGTEVLDDKKGMRSKPHMRLPVFAGREILPMVYQRVEGNTRIFTVAGPQGMGGASNSGERSIHQNIHAITQILTLISHEATTGGITGISLHIKSHSRNAVAAAYAINLIQERYKIGPRQLFSSIQVAMHDPVPGLGSQGDYPTRPMPDHPHMKTVVVYSIAAQDHRVGFDPLQVNNANVVVLTDDPHVGGVLKRFTSPSARRGATSSLTSLPDGIYGATASGREIDLDLLFPLTTEDDVRAFVNARFASIGTEITQTGFKTTRRNTIITAAITVLHRIQRQQQQQQQQQQHA